MEKNNKLITVLIVTAVVLIVLAITVGRTDNSPQVQSRNRVPNMQNYVKQAEDATQQAHQSAEDAKAAADAAAKTQKDIQAQIDKLNGQQRDSNGDLKEGRPEVSAPGIITDFGSFKIASDTGTTESSDFYLAFTFTDRNGFTKRFFPVCPNHTVKTGVPIILMYHWRTQRSTTEGERGCFQLDGFQTN